MYKSMLTRKKKLWLCIDIDFHEGLHTIVRVFFPKHGVSRHFLNDCVKKGVNGG